MEDLSQLAGCHRQIPEALLERARQLRKSQTPPEAKLWTCLRGRRLNGAKFRRQHNIGQFIADFYCHQAQLVIELDGPIHNQLKARDTERDAWMRANGLNVLRFENDCVQNDLITVLEEINHHVSKSFALREKDLG